MGCAQNRASEVVWDNEAEYMTFFGAHEQNIQVVVAAAPPPPPDPLTTSFFLRTKVMTDVVLLPHAAASLTD